MIMIATIIKIDNTIDNRPHLYWVRCLCCFLAVPGYFGWTIGVAAIVFMMMVVMIELVVVVVMVVVVVITLHCSPSALGGWWGCSSKVAARDLCSGWSAYQILSYTLYHIWSIWSLWSPYHMLSYFISYIILYIIICSDWSESSHCHHHQHCMVTWMSRRAISATSAPLSKSAKESITTRSLGWPLSKANHDLVFLKTTKTDKSSLVDKKRTPSLPPTFSSRPCCPQVRLFPHHFC